MGLLLIVERGFGQNLRTFILFIEIFGISVQGFKYINILDAIRETHRSTYSAIFIL